MFDDRVVIQNPGSLYGNNKFEKLGTDTIMEARNKNIIRILEEKGSIIENRHTGIPIMRNEMCKYNLQNPFFEEARGDFKVTFKNIPTDIDPNIDFIQGITQGIDQGIAQGEIFQKILEFCKEPKSAKEVAVHFGYSSHTYFRKKYIKTLIDDERLDMTIPDRPTSEKQKYITSNKKSKK